MTVIFRSMLDGAPVVVKLMGAFGECNVYLNNRMVYRRNVWHNMTFETNFIVGDHRFRVIVWGLRHFLLKAKVELFIDDVPIPRLDP